MIREDRKSKTRFIIFIVLYAVFIPFSIAWYNTIASIDCRVQGFGSDQIKIGSSVDNQQNCIQQTNFHWIKFYGINGAIYGAQLVGLIMTIKRKNTN